jgi:hypothetical protein
MVGKASWRPRRSPGFFTLDAACLAVSMRRMQILRHRIHPVSHGRRRKAYVVIRLGVPGRQVAAGTPCRCRCSHEFLLFRHATYRLKSLGVPASARHACLVSLLARCCAIAVDSAIELTSIPPFSAGAARGKRWRSHEETTKNPDQQTDFEKAPHFQTPPMLAAGFGWHRPIWRLTDLPFWAALWPCATSTPKPAVRAIPPSRSWRDCAAGRRLCP